ncbi:MAG TPA: hypothetical protein VGE41_09845 [Verrucomicrobiae bacterium]|jgi:hypothetical protein
MNKETCQKKRARVLTTLTELARELEGEGDYGLAQDCMQTAAALEDDETGGALMGLNRLKASSVALGGLNGILLVDWPKLNDEDEES